MPEAAPTVGIVSPGAMGSALGRVLATGGARVVATIAGRSRRTTTLAREAGLELLPDLGGVVRKSQLVVSVAPPDQAEAIAEAIAAAAARVDSRPLIADFNAISPATATRIETTLAAADLELVDGSISGPPPRKPRTTRIYLSGRSARSVLEFPFEGVTLIDVGEEVGAASAVKMSTAAIYKGTVALLTQALLAAHANGVVDHVLADLREGMPELVENAATTIARGAAKSARYVGEMHEIASTQAAAGLTPSLFEAMAAVYATIAATPLAEQSPEQVDSGLELEDVLVQARS